MLHCITSLNRFQFKGIHIKPKKRKPIDQSSTQVVASTIEDLIWSCIKEVQVQRQHKRLDPYRQTEKRSDKFHLCFPEAQMETNKLRKTQTVSKTEQQFCLGSKGEMGAMKSSQGQFLMT